MTEIPKPKRYDLEERTFKFAKIIESTELMNIFGAILKKIR